MGKQAKSGDELTKNDQETKVDKKSTKAKTTKDTKSKNAKTKKADKAKNGEELTQSDNEIKVVKKSTKAKTTKTTKDTKPKNAKTKKIDKAKSKNVSKDKSDNEKHRSRSKTKFLQSCGLGWLDYEYLELLLFFAIPRKDTKPLARRLISEFGDFARVIDADKDELMSCEGVGESVTVLIMLMKNIIKLYHDDKINHLSKSVFDTGEKFGEYFKEKLYTHSDEVVYVMFLDSASKMISCNLMSIGDLNYVNLDSKNIIEKALLCKASSIAISHNHPEGSLIPSEADVVSTRALRSDLEVINVRLVEHVIVNASSYFLMTKGNYI